MRYALLVLLAVELMVAGLNYAAVTVPTSPGVLVLTSAPHGGWVIPQHPKAVEYNGKTYIGWINGTTGGIYVQAFTTATGAPIGSPFLIDTPGIDDHNNPALLVRESDKRIIVAFSAHNGPGMFLRISTNAEDVTAFGSAIALDSRIGASDYTYPELYQLTGVADDSIYLFYRDVSGTTGRLAYSSATDAASGTALGWSARTIVLSGAAGLIPYWAVRANTTRIDVMATDRSAGGDEGAVDLGHFYIDGATGNRYKSDGTQITASMPFAHSELTQLETNVTAAFAHDGQSSANPVFAYMVDNGDGTTTAKYARWDGAAWDKGTIYTEDDHPGDNFYGSLAINPTDPEEVYSGIKSGADSSELYRFTSGDLGLTWDAGTAITSGSGDWNAAVSSVHNGSASLPIVWLRGIFRASDDFNFGIRALGV